MIVEADTSVNSIHRPARSEGMPTRRVPWSLDMRIFYRLAAFDRQTDEAIGSQVIPAELVAEIRKIAKIPRSDDGVGDFSLEPGQVRKIAKKLGITVNPESVDYFIEPYLQEKDSAQRISGGR
jgi:hypothetical protein